jgi:hypothetical protein
MGKKTKRLRADDGPAPRAATGVTKRVKKSGASTEIAVNPKPYNPINP